MMNPIVFHIASGQSFFSGLALLILAALVALSATDRLRRFRVIPAIVGILAIVLSSTAIPYAAYGLLAAALVGWIITCSTGRRRKTASILLAAACLACAGLELPYHIPPQLDPVDRRAFAILGDSVTAGLGENGEEIWPSILARTQDVQVTDLSHVGETAASALKRARQHTIDAPLVLVEIGGNDILGSTTARQFEQDLDALLAYIAAPGRQVVMFELPLPPFYHEFGRAQRAAARRHNVALVPKRVFLGLLAGNGATLDSIHLSQTGHEQMAETVWRLLAPAFAGTAAANSQTSLESKVQSVTLGDRPGRFETPSQDNQR